MEIWKPIRCPERGCRPTTMIASTCSATDGVDRELIAADFWPQRTTEADGVLSR